MENLSKFGIDPLQLGAQIVNFLILLYILKRFLYKPILQVLKKREEKIKEGLAAALAGQEVLLKAHEEEKTILVKAGEESKIMIEETKTRVERMGDEMLDRAKQEAQQLRKRAQREIEDEKKRIERQLEKKTVNIAVDVLARVLPKVLSRADQIRILENTQKRLVKTL